MVYERNRPTTVSCLALLLRLATSNQGRQGPQRARHRVPVVLLVCRLCDLVGSTRYLGLPIHNLGCATTNKQANSCAPRSRTRYSHTPTTGMIGAAMWVPINLLAIVAINELGLAIPIAYWYATITSCPTSVIDQSSFEAH